MCLISETDKAKIAESDIVCYKILVSVRDVLYTPYRDFVFNIGQMYKDKAPEMITPFNREFFIESGFFHAYTDLQWTMDTRDCIQSHLNRKYSKEGRVAKIYTAIIPKGSKIFENRYEHEICGNNMKIVEKCVD